MRGQPLFSIGAKTMGRLLVDFCRTVTVRGNLVTSCCEFAVQRILVRSLGVVPKKRGLSLISCGAVFLRGLPLTSP